jgi:S-adenosylmethionine decarboxylase
MAFDDTLFQLGMDLTRSSPAQKEDLIYAAPVANDDRKDFFVERDGVRFAGSHLIIDVFGGKRLDDLPYIKTTLERCARAAGATLLNVHLHPTSPKGGVAGVAVLAESHITIHSWPEAGYAALDVFMCGDTKPHLVVPMLKAAFDAADVQVKEHRRGEALEPRRWQAAARQPVSFGQAKAARRRQRQAA